MIKGSYKSLDFMKHCVEYIKCKGLDGSIRRVYAELAMALDVPWLLYSWVLPGPANRKEMRVLALRRSGQHAIINWIRHQDIIRNCFLNDCKPNGNPFETCLKKNSKIASRLAEHNKLFWNRETAGILSKKGILIYNFENAELGSVANDRFELKRENWLGKSALRFDIIILRDPYNLLASQLKWASGNKKNRYTPSFESLPGFVELWKSYAKEFLGETNYLENKVTISYNLWFKDKNYRAQVAKNLDLNFSDKGINEVAKWGPTNWGDSFDGLKYDGKASEMKVQERWKNYKNDAFYLKLISDGELYDLSTAIFGEIQGIKRILK